jgi:hypothetical protein
MTPAAQLKHEDSGIARIQSKTIVSHCFKAPTIGASARHIQVTMVTAHARSELVAAPVLAAMSNP